MISCPECGEDERLRGERRGERVRTSCETCGEVWDRIPGASCHRCGSSEVWTGPRALVERSRGTQLSITATTIVTLCRHCDAQEHEAMVAANRRFVMPDELPTTSGDERVRRD